MIYELRAPVSVIYEDLFIFIDPAAGGPSSDYGIMTVTRNRGILVVRLLNFCHREQGNSCGEVA